eukprot:NODE_380_length_9674_cov_0.149452.p7 type:complete len:144 gc:universal NODE_380_length_9674_cov_0.149452:3939-4370(+)
MQLLILLTVSYSWLSLFKAIASDVTNLVLNPDKVYAATKSAFGTTTNLPDLTAESVKQFQQHSRQVKAGILVALGSITVSALSNVYLNLRRAKYVKTESNKNTMAYHTGNITSNFKAHSIVTAKSNPPVLGNTMSANTTGSGK